MWEASDVINQLINEYFELKEKHEKSITKAIEHLHHYETMVLDEDDFFKSYDEWKEILLADTITGEEWYDIYTSYGFKFISGQTPNCTTEEAHELCKNAIERIEMMKRKEEEAKK